MPKLSSRQVSEALRRAPAWRRKARSIHRTFEFKDFPAAIRFVNAVARAAEKAWHHPDIDIRWNKVTLVLSTHDEGGLTERDFQLAARIDSLATRQRAG
jgi:4a-hydroxytetrahydrobiopterin dehydratase